MNMKASNQFFKIIILLLSVLFILLICILGGKTNGNNLESWVGTYEYVETFPHGLDENFNYFIGYTINIYEENGEYYANIASNGWQICSESLARIEGNETSIDLVFIKTLPGDSSFGRSERYDKDSVLLSFTRKDEGIQTEWGLLRNEHPIFIERDDEIVGKYFFNIE